MPARSVIDQLPPELRERIESELVKRGFAGYRELAQELSDLCAEAGLEVSISRSSLHRYGQELEERIRAIKVSTEAARTLAREVGDDEGALNDALMRLVQDKLFNVVLDLEIDPSKINILKLGHLVADLGRAAIKQKQYQIGQREKAAAAAARVEEHAKRAGVSAETIQLFRREILGIAEEPTKAAGAT